MSFVVFDTWRGGLYCLSWGMTDNINCRLRRQAIRIC